MVGGSVGLSPDPGYWYLYFNLLMSINKLNMKWRTALWSLHTEILNENIYLKETGKT